MQEPRHPWLKRLALLAWFIIPRLAAAHGVHAESVTGGYGLRAWYADGTPMAFAEVHVFAPADGASPWLEGWTDPGGVFVFLPPTGGLWRIVVDDGMGHALTHRLAIDIEAGITAGTLRQGARPVGPLRIVAGVGFIVGLFGLWALARGQPRLRSRTRDASQ